MSELLEELRCEYHRNKALTLENLMGEEMSDLTDKGLRERAEKTEWDLTTLCREESYADTIEKVLHVVHDEAQKPFENIIIQPMKCGHTVWWMEDTMSGHGFCIACKARAEALEEAAGLIYGQCCCDKCPEHCGGSCPNAWRTAIRALKAK